MKHTIQHGFTLVEIIIAVTILSTIMVSVMSVYTIASQMTRRVELSRSIASNTKMLHERFSESLRKYEIQDISPSIVDDCSPDGVTPMYHRVFSGSKLCLSTPLWKQEFFLWNYDGSDWVRVSDQSKCSDEVEDTESVCRLILRDENGDMYPLTQSNVAIDSMTFWVHNLDLPKLSLQYTIRPRYRAGIPSELSTQMQTHIQTTFSKRLIHTY